eukprot:gene30086-39281_t
MNQQVKEKVDLALSAKNLPKINFLRDNDTFAVIYLRNTKSGELSKVATTSVVRSNNPEWAAVYTVEYLFEVKQDIIIKLFDRESPTRDVNKESEHNLIGEVEVTLSVLCKNDSMSLPLLRGAKGEGGILTIRAEKQAYINDVFGVTFSAKKLNSSRTVFQPNPFITISSGMKSHTDKPKWEPIQIPMTTLCNGDKYCPLLIQVYDFESNGKNRFIGSFETSVNVLEERSVSGNEYSLVDPDKPARKPGTLIASNVHIDVKPTFLDFLRPGGCELSLVVAIDFTASNKPFTEPTSLHYLDSRGALNDYEKVIESVASVLATYDTDNKFTVLGFGARLESNGPVEHCFNVSENDDEVIGVDGIKQAYRERVGKLQFLGPTFFTPLIKEATQIAAAANCSKTKQKYTVLLILTDGCIHDVDRTLEAIRNASQEPLSIVIIGVGEEDFSGMAALERCEDAKRDIVQFLRYNDVANEPQSVLTTEVLKKVPAQLLEYMDSHSILPIKLK